MWLVYDCAHCREPSRVPHVKGLSASDDPPAAQGGNLPLPGRATVLGSGFTLLLAQTHARYAHTNRTFCIGVTALPSLFSLSCRAK